MSIEHYRIPGGPVVVTGQAAFTSTATTDELSVKTLKRIHNVFLTPAQTPGANDVLGLNETLLSDGSFSVDADGDITIARPGSGTSNLKYYYRIEGES